jgi:NAD(P)-dependent dehydrogenase (short-subunit alcohol dehydrogenase family)
MGTVAVTGSASGIGAATRDRLLEQGHHVIGVDVTEGDVVVDLGTATGRQTAIAEVLAACGGRLDGLVTAAGVPPRFAAAEIVSINYFGTTALLTGLQGALAAAGSARAVAISSVMASTIPGVSPELVDLLVAGDEEGARRLVSSYERDQHLLVYAATKVAIARWVRRHAPTPEWARAGIRLNAIAPGATRTSFFAGLADDDERVDRIPVGFAATAEQIAGWVVLMLGADAEFMCGSVVYVDGGGDARRNADAWPAVPRRVVPRGPQSQPQRGSVLRRLLRRG